MAYRASSETAQDGPIDSHLLTLGCRKIVKSFWEVDEEKMSTAAKTLHNNYPVFLKRIREIRKPGFTKERTCSELGSLIVVAYEVPKEGNRGKIKSFLKRAPYIRLCRGVHAFPQRQERFDKSGRLADARSFWEFARGIDENPVMIPRVIIVNNQAVERLLTETGRRVEKEVRSIVEGYKILYQKVKRGEIDRQHALSMTRKLRRRFIIVKKVASFYEEWLKIDFSSVLMKPYPAIRKVRFLLDEEYGTVH